MNKQPMTKRLALRVALPLFVLFGLCGKHHARWLAIWLLGGMVTYALAAVVIHSWPGQVVGAFWFLMFTTGGVRRHSPLLLPPGDGMAGRSHG